MSVRKFRLPEIISSVTVLLSILIIHTPRSIIKRLNNRLSKWQAVEKLLK